jgi:hypothetical protein
MIYSFLTSKFLSFLVINLVFKESLIKLLSSLSLSLSLSQFDLTNNFNQFEGKYVKRE